MGYNVRGNLVYRNDRGAETWYLWNTDDMLAEIQRPDGRRVAYDYDALQRRAKRAAFDPAAAQWTEEYFRFDMGWNPVGDYAWNPALGEGGGGEGGGQALRAYYVYEGGLDSIVAKAMPDPANPGAWTTLFFLTDHLGSVTALVDEGGNVVEQYEYDVYGNVTIKDESGV